MVGLENQGEEHRKSGEWEGWQERSPQTPNSICQRRRHFSLDKQSIPQIIHNKNLKSIILNCFSNTNQYNLQFEYIMVQLEIPLLSKGPPIQSQLTKLFREGKKKSANSKATENCANMILHCFHKASILYKHSLQRQ